jgi:integrase
LSEREGWHFAFSRLWGEIMERERDGIRKVQGKRGVRWQAKAACQGMKPTYKTFGNRSDAKRWKKSTEAAMVERRHFAYAEADKHTLSALVERYIDSQKPPNKTAAYLRHAARFFGNQRLSDITTATIVEYRDHLAKKTTNRGTKRAPATVNRYIAYLSSAYTTAIKEWQWVQNNPVTAVKKLVEPKGRVRYLSASERQRLLNACEASPSENLYPLVMLALSCGARVGELLNLRWKDVDLGNGRATLHNTKNGERRAISIKGRAQELLRHKSKVRRLETDLVFPSASGLGTYDYCHPFKAALNAAEIENFRFHDLRHTCASYLAMNGASIPEIAAVLGHKSWAMTQRYSHLSDAHISDVVERMNEKVLGG